MTATSRLLVFDTNSHRMESPSYLPPLARYPSRRFREMWSRSWCSSCTRVSCCQQFRSWWRPKPKFRVVASRVVVAHAAVGPPRCSRISRLAITWCTTCTALACSKAWRGANSTGSNATSYICDTPTAACLCSAIRSTSYGNMWAATRHRSTRWVAQILRASNSGYATTCG